MNGKPYKRGCTDGCKGMSDAIADVNELSGIPKKKSKTFKACETYLTRVAHQGAKAVEQVKHSMIYNTIKDAFLVEGGTMPEVVEPKPLEPGQEYML